MEILWINIEPLITKHKKLTFFSFLFLYVFLVVFQIFDKKYSEVNFNDRMVVVSREVTVFFMAFYFICNINQKAMSNLLLVSFAHTF